MGANCFDSILGREPGSLEMVETSKHPHAKKSRSGTPCEEILAASCSTEITMDPQIWKGFPEDLLEVMIARLPVAAFFRFRSVCQKWNSILISATLPQHFAEVLEARPPWIYAVTDGDANCGAMYDPTIKKWFRRPIPFLATESINYPVASAGSFVCLLDVRVNNLSVWNPLASSFRQLHASSSYEWPNVMIGMVQYGFPEQTGYRIVCLGSNGYHEVYDSVQNSWICPGKMPPDVKQPLGLNFSSHTVSIGNMVYFMRSDPDGILSYDVVTSAWKQLIFPLPSHVKDRTLAECGGRLLLVGVLSKNAAMCVGIWELRSTSTTLVLKEVDRMPNVWCFEFYGKHMWMSCMGNRGMLVLSLNSRRLRMLVSYDVEKREWGKVADCVLPPYRRRRHLAIACGVPFYPCPTSVA